MIPSLTYWIFAWCLMGVAFVTATGAILFGAMALDRQPSPPDHEDQASS